MERTCPHCGAELPDTSDAFCGECREPLDEDPATAEPDESEEPPEADVPLRDLALEEVVFNGMTREELAEELERGGRFVVFKYCISPIFVTIQNGSRLHFRRAEETGLGPGWKYNLLTLLLGWWGFPWGPIYSLSAISTNMAGGLDVTADVLQRLRRYTAQPA